MADLNKYKIPTFGGGSPVSSKTESAIAALQSQGLLPKQTVNKQELTKDDRELGYICTVYASLMQGVQRESIPAS